MQYITVRSIFILLLVAGSLTIALAKMENRGSSPAINEEYVIPLIVVDGKKFFVMTGSACGCGSINCYKSLDGVQVCRSGGAYTKSAERALQAILKEGIVIERGAWLDGAGQVLGERVVFVYQKKDTGRQAAAVCRIGVDGIECIDGDSLEHVMNFEKGYR